MLKSAQKRMPEARIMQSKCTASKAAMKPRQTTIFDIQFVAAVGGEIWNEMLWRREIWNKQTMRPLLPSHLWLNEMHAASNLSETGCLANARYSSPWLSSISCLCGCAAASIRGWLTIDSYWREISMSVSLPDSWSYAAPEAWKWSVKCQSLFPLYLWKHAVRHT